MQMSIDLRPRRFSDVYGQGATVKSLQKRAKSKEWPNAMLLKGMTGTGKTTVAQIIAMVINCKSLDEIGNPCCKCDSCRSIIEERFDRDTMRLDGSASSKSDVIDFGKLANVSPMYDKNSVFIIEEADSLSKTARDALLKLLEKPLKNTYFILLSMLPAGISLPLQSRCQVFSFSPFMKKDILLALRASMIRAELWEKQGIPITFYKEVIPCIADACQGSLRSAIQLLENCIIGEYYTLEDVKNTLGIVSSSTIMDILLNLLRINKKFFADFDSVDFQEFFHISYAMLSDAAAYSISEYTKNEYYETGAKILSQEKNLFTLLSVYDKIFTDGGSYLKKSYLISVLAKYFKDNMGKARIYE